MEITNDHIVDSQSADIPLNYIDVTSNWSIDNNKQLRDTISVSQDLTSTSLDDTVSLNTCIALRPKRSDGACMLDVKVTNGRRIAKVAVVSEACVLEFFKQYGEYASTVFATFVDDFDDKAVYSAEIDVEVPTPEISIKFTKTKSKGSVMWLYGVRLILIDPTEDNVAKFNYENIVNKCPDNFKEATMAKKLLHTFATNQNADAYLRRFVEMSLNVPNGQNKGEKEEGINVADTKEGLTDLKEYIDNKFRDLETRLMRRIDCVEYKIHEKLELLLRKQ